MAAGPLTREALRRRRLQHEFDYRLRKSLGLPTGEPDDEIPEWEAEARKAAVEEAKRAKAVRGLIPELEESELAEVLP